MNDQRSAAQSGRCSAPRKYTPGRTARANAADEFVTAATIRRTVALPYSASSELPDDREKGVSQRRDGETLRSTEIQ
jgi:hypothetical protein